MTAGSFNFSHLKETSNKKLRLTLNNPGKASVFSRLSPKGRESLAFCGVKSGLHGLASFFRSEVGIREVTELNTNPAVANGPECVKIPGHTLAMISENFIAREAHETVYSG